MKPRADRPYLTTYADARRARYIAAAYAAVPSLLIGVGIMLGIHLALSMRSDRIHTSAVASIQAADALLLRMCLADVARYEDIRQLERDAVAEMERREAGR